LPTVSATSLQAPTIYIILFCDFSKIFNIHKHFSCIFFYLWYDSVEFTGKKHSNSH